MRFLFYFIFASAVTVVLVPVIKRIAYRFQVLDFPLAERKIHKKPTPLLGGVAVGLAFLLGLSLYLFSGHADFSIIPARFFAAIFISIVILTLGGILDDKYSLSAKVTWVFPGLASAVCVFLGIGVGITSISNPFGGTISIDQVYLGLPLSAVFSFVWLLGMTYTTKILDGMDGLVSGIGIIGSFTLFFLSLTEKVNQPMTAMLSLLLAGALLGFLFYNFNPASIFLGEAGSTMVGFLLGLFSIILGGKIATALLVMGIPILDVAWAIVRRLVSGVSPFSGDRKHLHFRLLDIGLNQRQSVYVLWGISAVFGFTAVFLQGLGKLVALLILFVVMIVLAIGVVLVYKRQGIKK